MTDGKTCNSGIPRPKRPWTDEEERYLRAHRNDGAVMLAVALRRSPQSVRNKAARLGVSLVMREGDVCPRCGTYEIREGTAAARMGLCPVCFRRKLAKALEERNATVEANRAYERAKFHGRARKGRERDDG